MDRLTGLPQLIRSRAAKAGILLDDRTIERIARHLQPLFAADVEDAGATDESAAPAPAG